MKWQLLERYVKLVISGFALYDDELFVKESFLRYLGMPNSIRVLIAQSRQANKPTWISRNENGHLLIQLSSIPDRTRTKLNLNVPQDYMKELLVTHRGYFDQTHIDEVKAESYLMIQKEIANYKAYLPSFYGVYTTEEERVTQSINMAILKVILFYVKRYPKGGLMNHFFMMLSEEKIAKHTIPVPSLNYFYKYVARVMRTGLPQGLINANRGRASNNLKLTNNLKDLIIFLKAYGNYVSCREIYQNLKKLGTNKIIAQEIKQVSESTISKFLATKEADNLTLLARQGYAKFEERVLGYLPLNRTQYPLSKVLIDGYVLQVICEGDDGQPMKMVLVTIMDTYSGHVTMEIGDVEDYKLIRACFEKFLSFTQYKLPKEIVSDRHASHQSKYFDNFRNYLVGNGVIWHADSNPKRKAQLERWFGTLQQLYLTKVIGYVGEGIKSKRKDAHPSREVQLVLRRRDFLKGKNEVKRIILSAGDDYNRNARFSDAASPLDLYHLKQPRHYIQLQDYHLPYFFWDKHEVSIRGSMIILTQTIDGQAKRWFYRNMDYDFSIMNGSKVDAYHLTTDDRYLYLFERGTIIFKCKVEKQLKANEARFEQSEGDKKIIADFGISKKQLHEAFINKLDDIETSVQKTFDKFGFTTDQLLKLAGRKKRMDEGYEGYKAGITTPKEEPNLRKHYKIKKGRGAIRNRKKSKSSTTDGGSFEITDTLG